MSKPARIVLLNGVGSVGKTSIAKALQTLTRDIFLHIQMDAFLEMLPDGKLNDPDCFTFETQIENGKPSVVIRTGPTGEKLMRGMRRAIAAMAQQGNNLIVDDVMLGNDAADYAEILATFQVFRVGVFAPLDVLEARERQRGDRLIGLARWQYDRVHQGIAYDLEIDASEATSMDCAGLIKERFSL
jgi:chloramphenicol 3-O phosphotransferase